MSGPSKVVAIGTGAPVNHGEPNPALIEGIESMLDRAKSGELRSLVACGFVGNGDRLTFFGGELKDDVCRMRGSIAWLESEYVDDVVGRKA